MEEAVKDLSDQFSTIDRDQTGYISAEDCRSILLNHGALPAQVDEFIQQFGYRRIILPTCHTPAELKNTDDVDVNHRPTGSRSPRSHCNNSFLEKEKECSALVLDYRRLIEYFQMVSECLAFSCSSDGGRRDCGEYIRSSSCSCGSAPSVSTRKKRKKGENTENNAHQEKEKEEGKRSQERRMRRNRLVSPFPSSSVKKGMEPSPSHTTTRRPKRCISTRRKDTLSYSPVPSLTPYSSSCSSSSHTFPLFTTTLGKNTSEMDEDCEVEKIPGSSARVTHEACLPSRKIFRLVLRYAAAHPSGAGFKGSSAEFLSSAHSVSSHALLQAGKRRGEEMEMEDQPKYGGPSPPHHYGGGFTFGVSHSAASTCAKHERDQKVGSGTPSFQEEKIIHGAALGKSAEKEETIRKETPPTPTSTMKTVHSFPTSSMLGRMIQLAKGRRPTTPSPRFSEMRDACRSTSENFSDDPIIEEVIVENDHSENTSHCSGGHPLFQFIKTEEEIMEEEKERTTLSDTARATRACRFPGARTHPSATIPSSFISSVCPLPPHDDEGPEEEGEGVSSFHRPTHSLLSLHEVFSILQKESSAPCRPHCPIFLDEIYHIWRSRGLGLSWLELDATAESLGFGIGETTPPFRSPTPPYTTTTPRGERSNENKQQVIKKGREGEGATHREMKNKSCEHCKEGERIIRKEEMWMKRGGVSVEDFCLLVSRLRPSIARQIRTPEFWRGKEMVNPEKTKAKVEMEEDHTREISFTTQNKNSRIPSCRLTNSSRSSESTSRRSTRCNRRRSRGGTNPVMVVNAVENTPFTTIKVKAQQEEEKNQDDSEEEEEGKGLEQKRVRDLSVKSSSCSYASQDSQSSTEKRYAIIRTRTIHEEEKNKVLTVATSTGVEEGQGLAPRPPSSLPSSILPSNANRTPFASSSLQVPAASRRPDASQRRPVEMVFSHPPPPPPSPAAASTTSTRDSGIASSGTSTTGMRRPTGMIPSSFSDSSSRHSISTRQNAGLPRRKTLSTASTNSSARPQRKGKRFSRCGQGFEVSIDTHVPDAPPAVPSLFSSSLPTNTISASGRVTMTTGTAEESPPPPPSPCGISIEEQGQEREVVEKKRTERLTSSTFLRTEAEKGKGSEKKVQGESPSKEREGEMNMPSSSPSTFCSRGQHTISVSPAPLRPPPPTSSWTTSCSLPSPLCPSVFLSSGSSCSSTPLSWPLSSFSVSSSFVSHTPRITAGTAINTSTAPLSSPCSPSPSPSPPFRVYPVDTCSNQCCQERNPSCATKTRGMTATMTSTDTSDDNHTSMCVPTTTMYSASPAHLHRLLFPVLQELQRRRSSSFPTPTSRDILEYSEGNTATPPPPSSSSSSPSLLPQEVVQILLEKCPSWTATQLSEVLHALLPWLSSSTRPPMHSASAPPSHKVNHHEQEEEKPHSSPPWDRCFAGASLPGGRSLPHEDSFQEELLFLTASFSSSLPSSSSDRKRWKGTPQPPPEGNTITALGEGRCEEGNKEKDLRGHFSFSSSSSLGVTPRTLRPDENTDFRRRRKSRDSSTQSRRSSSSSWASSSSSPPPLPPPLVPLHETSLSPFPSPPTSAAVSTLPTHSKSKFALNAGTSPLLSSQEKEFVMRRIQKKVRYLVRQAFLAAGILEKERRAPDGKDHHYDEKGDENAKEKKKERSRKNHPSCATLPLSPPFAKSIARIRESFYAFEKEMREKAQQRKEAKKNGEKKESGTDVNNTDSRDANNSISNTLRRMKGGRHETQITSSSSSFDEWKWEKDDFAQWIHQLFRQRLGRDAPLWVVKQCLSIVSSPFTTSPSPSLSPSSSSLSRNSSLEDEGITSIHIEPLLEALANSADSKSLLSDRHLRHDTLHQVCNRQGKHREGKEDIYDFHTRLLLS